MSLRCSQSFQEFSFHPPENRVRRLSDQGQGALEIGIQAVQILGETPLENEFSEFSGKQLRSRLFTLDTEAVIGLHLHQERSGFVYVVSGEIIEHRNDSEEPITHQKGALIVEENGVEHYWENKSDSEVKLLSFDIFTPSE